MQRVEDWVLIHSSDPTWDLSSCGLELDFFSWKTCQRSLALALPLKVRDGVELSHLQLRLKHEKSVTIFKGIDAYETLLKIVCGLESQLLGETEILAQFKKAWAEYPRKTSSLGKSLSPLFQNILADAKEVRTLYLRNLGSQSYGGLVRSLFPREAEKVLVVGAGQLSEKMLPWLMTESRTVFLANRHEGRRDDLIQRVSNQCSSGALLPWEYMKSSESPWDVVITAVPGPAFDVYTWVSGVQKNHGLWFDLGTPRIQNPSLSGVSGPQFDLQELFELQKKAQSHRLGEKEAAVEACRRKALDRSQPEPLTLVHGWDDLWGAAAL